MRKLPLLLLTLVVPLHGAVYHVGPKGEDSAEGSSTRPFRTIQRGVDQLQPGDTLVVGAGVYREAIAIRDGGTKQAPIVIVAEHRDGVVVTGADPLTSWRKADDAADRVYEHDWPHVFAIDHRNGKPILTHPNDREHEVIGRAEQVVHDGRLLRQVLRREQLAPGTFFVDLENKRLYVWLADNGDPAKADMEASVRPTWLTGRGSAAYVRVKGITFRHAANHAQRGALRIGGEGWVIEDCVMERANAVGASFSGRGHMIRRCIFQDNGQMGFGASRCHDTTMADCGLYRNNAKGYSTDWEAGGCKVVLSRGFVFDGCTSAGNRGCGIWYDIGNEKSVVRRCTIRDNDGAGIFYEISYGLHAHDNLIVNNANLRPQPRGDWGMAGITLSSSQGCIVEHNTVVGNRDGVAFREQDRSTPRIEEGKSVRIFNRTHIVRNNIIAHCRENTIAFWFDMPFFGGQGASEDPATLDIRLEHNVLWGEGGRITYLYGAPWKNRSKRFGAPRAFTTGSGIGDTSTIADPMFIDPPGGDFGLNKASPVLGADAGQRVRQR